MVKLFLVVTLSCYFRLLFKFKTVTYRKLEIHLPEQIPIYHYKTEVYPHSWVAVSWYPCSAVPTVASSLVPSGVGAWAPAWNEAACCPAGVGACHPAEGACHPAEGACHPAEGACSCWAEACSWAGRRDEESAGPLVRGRSGPVRRGAWVLLGLGAGHVALES